MWKILILASFSNRIKKYQNDETKYIHRKKKFVNLNHTVLNMTDISIPAPSFLSSLRLGRK